MRTIEQAMSVIDWEAIMEEQRTNVIGDNIWILKDCTFQVLAQGLLPDDDGPLPKYDDDVLCIFSCDETNTLEEMHERFRIYAGEHFPMPSVKLNKNSWSMGFHDGLNKTTTNPVEIADGFSYSSGKSAGAARREATTEITVRITTKNYHLLCLQMEKSIDAHEPITDGEAVDMAFDALREKQATETTA